MSTPDRSSAAAWARALVTAPDGFVILDTETTGLNRARRDEACQIAVIDQAGSTLFDSLIFPTVPIDAGAAQVHGIDQQLVAKAPKFKQVLPQLRQVLAGRKLVIYNAAYDLQILHNMLIAEGIVEILVERYFELESCDCAMEQYAAFFGDWNDYHHNYRWQRLTAACAQQRIPDPKAPAHSALGDCLRTLAIVKKMAQSRA